MKQSRARNRPKLVPQQADEYEDNMETVFKHYDNKFFDMDELPKDSLVRSIPVPNMEIQELQQYVTKCYDDLYKNFNEFKRSITSQLHSLQEEVQTLSFHNSSKNDGVFPQAVKESPSQAYNGRPEAAEGRKETWGSKSHEYEKDAAPFHQESRLQQHPESRSPVQIEEPTPEKRTSYHPTKDDEEQLLEHIPAGAWSNFMANITETSSSHKKHPTKPAAEKRQLDSTYLSRHLHGSSSHPPNNTTRKGNESWHEVEMEEEYDAAEQENEQAIEKMVSEYNNHKKSNNVENGQPGGGRDRFTLHGWAASFLQQTAEGQLSKVNKQTIKQETIKYNDKERPGSQVEMEQSVAEMEITSKRHGKGSTSQELKQARHTTHTYVNSVKPDGKRQQPQPPRGTTNAYNSDPKFPGKKCRGGIAWTVDELAEQNKQRAVN